MTEILLINMQYPSYSTFTNYFPVGLGILSEQLIKNNISHSVCDLGWSSFDDLVNTIKTLDPKYVGFSLLSLDIYENYKIIKQIKSIFPEKLIIVGGPHVSFIKEEIFEECPSVDFALVHEGEYSLVSLLKNEPYENIKGLIYKKEGQIIYNPIDCMLENLDDIGFPKYEKFDIKKYGRLMSIISSRGCPFQCTFCGAHLSMGKKWRSRSPESVVEEIKYWVEKGYKKFNFVDSNFFHSKKRVIEIFDLLKENNLDVSLFSDGMRANDVTEEIIDLMKEFNFKRIAMGIESANEHILKNIKKGETLVQIKKAMDILLKKEINVIAFFILGLPGDNIFSTLKSFWFALKYPNIETAYFFNINPLYKTELYNWAFSNGYLSMSREEIYQNIGGQGTDILLSTKEYPKYQRKVMFLFSKIVSKIIFVRHKNWVNKKRKK